jgi:hypothetical protein
MEPCAIDIMSNLLVNCKTKFLPKILFPSLALKVETKILCLKLVSR